jgi:hypothetical protein
MNFFGAAWDQFLSLFKKDTYHDPQVISSTSSSSSVSGDSPIRTFLSEGHVVPEVKDKK